MKRLMAKIGAASLALLLALGAASCAKEEGPAANYETFKAAAEKTSALEDLNMSAELDVNAAASGETMNIGVDLTAQAKDMDENPQMSMSMNVDMAGEQQSMGFYYADGIAYLDQAGIKQKMELPMEDVTSAMGGQPLGLDITVPDESEMENAEYAKENGNVVVTMAATAEEIQALMGGLSSSMDGLGDATADIGSLMEMMEWKDITLKITINPDQYITQVDFTAGLSISAEGESGDIDVTAVIKLVDPGKDFTVTAPGDLDSYEAA